MSRSRPDAVVDVLLPVYNAAATINEAVASIQRQTISDMRIIAINDGSSDDTGELLRRLAADDPRIQVVEQPNRGLVDTLNVGLSMCTSELVARFDGDDLCDPDRLERQIACLDSDPACVGVSGAFRRIDESGRVVTPVFRFASPDAADMDACPQVEPYLLHPFLMVRRSAVLQVGGYRHAFLAEDTDLYWRLREVGTLINLDEVLGSYRISTTSVSGSSILNGRISAVNSQLSGLSARRRRAGRSDVSFEARHLEDCRNARSLAGILEVASRQLDPEEAEWLAACASAKLLELANHRPYELEPEDCAFVRRAIQATTSRMDAASRANCERMMSGTAARMAAAGMIRAAVLLLPARSYPSALARLVSRLVLSDGVRRVLLRAVGRAAFAK